MHVMKQLLNKSKIIIGGGPVGSAAAAALSKRFRDVMLVHDPDDLGSHNDKSRLIRLALEEDSVGYQRSVSAVNKLLDYNESLETPFISSSPGVLFAATQGTPLANKLSKSSYPKLQFLSSKELRSLYADFSFNFPEDTLFWFHPEGHVVNPIKLSASNILAAKDNGCKIIEARAGLAMQDEQVLVEADGREYAASDIYLLAGARNKEMLEGCFADRLSHQLSTVNLTAISIRRYSVGDQSYPLMPIMVGELIFGNYPHIFDFSTMPESENIIKTRLSGFSTSERIDRVDLRSSLDDAEMKVLYDEFFPSISPAFSVPMDFQRCVTYRNSDQQDPTSYLALSLSSRVKQSSTQKISTTLGCFGTHVRYSLLLGEKFADDAQAQPANVSSLVVGSDAVNELAVKTANTPLKKLNASLSLKLETENFTGSMVDRSILYFFSRLLKKGQPGERTTLVTAGSVDLFESIKKIKTVLERDYDIQFNVVVIVPKFWQRPYGEQKELSGLSTVGLSTNSDVAGALQSGGDACLFFSSSIRGCSDFAEYLSNEKDIVYFNLADEDNVQFIAESLREEVALQLPSVTDMIVPNQDSAVFLDKKFKFLSGTPRVHFFAKSLLKYSSANSYSTTEHRDDLAEVEAVAAKILSNRPDAVIAGIVSGRC